MVEYIEREALLDDLKLLAKYQEGERQQGIFGVCITIKNRPTADVVSREVFEQVKWERDTALKTLEEHGIGLAQKPADVVEVVRCKDCKFFKRDTDYCKKRNKGYCYWDNTIKTRTHFCSYGEKKEGATE